MKEDDKFVLNNLTKSLRRLKRRPCGRSRIELPKDILSDHGSQFKEQWKEWYRECRVEVYFARPSHPQDKG
jgi:IS30 family transposase